MRTLLQTLFFLLLVTQICFAQWEWQNPLPQGNNLNDVAFDGSFGIAVGDFGTIIRTTDGGLSWAVQESGTTNDLNGIGYNIYRIPIVVGDSGIILQSTDTGLSWTKQSNVTQSELNKITFENCPGYIVGDSGIILKTSDDGINWDIQQSGTLNRMNGVSFIDGENGWVIGDSLVLHTSDGGITWINQTSLSKAHRLKSVYFIDINNGWIAGGYKSRTGHQIIYHTSDGGTTWITQLDAISSMLYDITFSDNNLGIAIGSDGIILSSTTGGANWETQNSGSKNKLLGIQLENNSNGWVVGENGVILQSTNSGINWSEKSFGTNFYYSYKKVVFTDLANGWSIMRNLFDYYMTGSNLKSQIFRTTDGGITWAEQFSDTLIYLDDICFTDNSNGWAAGENGVILHTINGGTNWFLQTSGTTNQIHSVSFIDQNNGTAVGDMAIILRTNDGGNTWYQQSYGMTRHLFDVHFTDINNGIAVGGTIDGNAAILSTSNGGTNWSLNLLGYGWLNALSFCDERNGLAVGEHGRIFRTTNSGESWLQQSSNTDLPLNDVVCIDSSLGVVVGGYSYYSPYNGEWYQMQVLLQTEDGGINWSKQSSGSINGLNGISFIDENNGWIVGDRGIILHTTNGGVSFVEEEQIDEIPTEFLLSQNYPNPFNPSTKIKYSIPNVIANEVKQSQFVTLKVFDILGNEIETLVNEEKPVGTYELNWNAANLPSGVYFYQLRAGNYVNTKKMLLLK